MFIPWVAEGKPSVFLCWNLWKYDMKLHMWNVFCYIFLLVKKLCFYLIEISVESKFSRNSFVAFFSRKKISAVKCFFVLLSKFITHGRLSNMKEEYLFVIVILGWCKNICTFALLNICLLYWHTLFDKCGYVIHQK